MTDPREARPLSRQWLVDYFLAGAKPRDGWCVGLEVEKMGRLAGDGAPLAYDGADVTVRRVLEWLLERRGGQPVLEADHLVGIDAAWGTLSLEPGGQLEWSSRPAPSLETLRRDLAEHLDCSSEVGRQLGVRWLDVGVDPELPLARMNWMPKARYKIMREHLGRRGRLAHRMMTQTASIQCAFDYSDEEDWRRKFTAAARLGPVSTALFANSSRVDGRPSGHASYRQAIWRETDPARCGLPAVVFRPDLDLERWVDWVLDVPTLFLHRARGLVPSSGEPFRSLLERTGCDAIRMEDWETHLSTIFTDVRSYGYIEVRTADLLPDPLVFAVPAFWTGILYSDAALAEATQLTAEHGDHDGWTRGMARAAERGLEDPGLRELAGRAVGLALRGLRRDAACVGDRDAAAAALETLAERVGLPVIAP